MSVEGSTGVVKVNLALGPNYDNSKNGEYTVTAEAGGKPAIDLKIIVKQVECAATSDITLRATPLPWTDTGTLIFYAVDRGGSTLPLRYMD